MMANKTVPGLSKEEDFVLVAKDKEDVDVGAALNDKDHDHDDDVETGDSTSSMDEDQDQKTNLAKKETKAVFRLRLLVILVLFLAAVAVSVIVYTLTANAEEAEYKNQYEGAAKKVLESFMDIVDSKLGAVTSIAIANIAHGVDHVKSWPFVTLSSFQQRASTARKQSGAMYVHINPMVANAQKTEWEAFVSLSSEDSYWIGEGIEYQKDIGLIDLGQYKLPFNTSNSWPVWTRNADDTPVVDGGEELYMPTWQTSPVFYGGSDVNENLLKSSSLISKAMTESFYSASVVIGEFITSEPGDMHASNPRTARIAMMMSAAENKDVEYAGDPISQIFVPIFDSFRDDRKSVAIMGAWIHWSSYFQNILPSSLRGIDVVMHDTCSGSYTYKINGEDVHPVGKGDLHDIQYDDMKMSSSFSSVDNIGDGTKFGLPLNKEHCLVSVDVYPSTVFHDTYNTSTPIIMTVAVAMVFIFTACMFIFYDRLVERRQALVMHKALQTTAIVSSLFPENVRDRLMKQTPGLQDNSKSRDREGSVNMMPGRRLKGYLNGAEEDDMTHAPPIADLFPNCTVLFADIAGFTAWSSTRDPEQVFTLLQTVYQAFDRIAKRRKVFKVETIGDSYLAVCGLPEPQLNHAVVMVRFAWDCMQKMQQVTRLLELSLGPDTGNLSMRFGLHSGPVTAGVLRGERARFQLFGDTVNTASRMESNGQRGKIQISQATASLISEADREYWLTEREEKVTAKGKGLMTTFWADPTNKRGSSANSSQSDRKEDDIEQTNSILDETLDSANQRLIGWVVDILMDDIKKILHVRRQSGIKEGGNPVSFHPPEGTTCMQEVKTVIAMPKFDSKKANFNMMGDYNKAEISPAVVASLREYVTMIASLYRGSNPFHNFEHACHVTMSVKKLLKRIVAPELSNQDIKTLKKNPNNLAGRLHDYTHGITSDPLAVFAITFSALIHDVDHRGVSNSQLAEEDPALGGKYSNQSIAEQNSLDLAWEILMRDQFDALRQCLFSSQAELMRFRQLIVNVVLATDIFDKQLNDLRKERWARAFCAGDGGSPSRSPGSSQISNNGGDSDLRATIVLEHIIQASDVSHCMQHWHVYQKWNRALFQEMHRAFLEGRMAKDPSTFWYQGELGFFDNYIIPLAKKLKECGVFGVSSDEYLNYALQNRNEWEERGLAVVQSITEQLNAAASLEKDQGKEDENSSNSSFLSSIVVKTQPS